MDRVFRGFFLVLGLCGIVGLSAGQDDKAPKKGGIPTNEIVNGLNDAFKAKHEPNSKVALEKAVLAYQEKDRPDRDKAQILKAVQTGLGNRNDRVKLVTVNALGRIGPEAAKPLAKAMGLKDYQKNRELLAATIDALGLTRDEKTAVNTLLKVVQRHNDWTVRALAGRALGNFDKNVAKGNTRKKICESLIQIYEGIQSQASDGRDSDAIRKETAIRGDFVATLRGLTEQEWQSALDWRKWFNKAKKKSWPNPPKKKVGKK